MCQIKVGCEVNYHVNAPTSFLFNVAVARTDHQKVAREDFRLDPDREVRSCSVGESNRVHRVLAQDGPLRISYEADVSVVPTLSDVPEIEENPHSEIPPEALTYLNPSRYCESDELSEFAQRQFGSLPHGYSRVKSICDWTFEHLSYSPGSTNSSSTASDVLISRAGVCRDFAHLTIAMCRGLGIPSRYVSGYAIGLEPPDFHGFVEAFLEDRWYLFDPTRLAKVGGLVRIGTGRDAADTPFATVVGSAALESMNVWAKALEENRLLNEDPRETGISTA